jgi:hypothetical protein
MKTRAQSLPSKALSAVVVLPHNEIGNDSLNSLELDGVLLLLDRETDGRRDTLNSSSSNSASRRNNGSSSGMLGQSSTHSLLEEEGATLDFLKRVPAQRRWKNKRFWKTPARRISGRTSTSQGASSPFLSPDDEEATKRRSLIHDSLLKGLDDDSVGKYDF